MRNKLKKFNSEGFTIIEVMIVLAIAGLILLIVFLAVPALQRSGRNTQRKNDIGSIATGINNFITNNNGQLPTGITVAADGQTTIAGAAGTVSSNDAKMGYYAAASYPVKTFGTAINLAQAPPPPNTFFGLIGTASAAAAGTVGPDSFEIVTGATCQGGTLSAGNTGVASGTSRSYSIVYELEQSGSSATTGGVPQCQGS